MTDETRDPHVLAPGHAPTPFTADEIRRGCPAGRRIRLRVDPEAETPYLRVSRFSECDEAGATLERSRQALDGSPFAEPEVDRVTWRDLQAHASFPTDDTTIEPERIETAIGTLDCLRYTVRDGATEQVFWFATDLPGMPIRSLTRTDGRVVATVSVVDDTMPPPHRPTPSGLRRLVALSGPDRVLLARAAGWVVLARLALWTLPYRRTRDLADRLAAPRRRRGPAPARTAWAVEATARRIPKASCLTRALAADVMLRRDGHRPQIHIGVAKDRAAFEAHAWLELGGRVLVGDHDLGRYTRLQPPPS